MPRKYKSDEYYESEPVSLTVSEVSIGLATVDIGDNNTVALGAGVAAVGFATVDVQSNTAWSDPNTYIGLATVDMGANSAWSDPNTYIGLATVDVGKDAEYSYAYTSGPTTDWIVKGSAGFLKGIVVGTAVASSVIEISDHATDGDGAVKFHIAGDTVGPASYPIDATMGTGITLDVTAQTHLTVIYR